MSAEKFHWAASWAVVLVAGLCAFNAIDPAFAGDYSEWPTEGELPPDLSWAHARETMKAFQQDPLRVRPQDLGEARSLPGDGVAPDCSRVIALDRPLALPDAVDLALCANPQVKATWAGIKAGVASLGEAKAAYLPTLNAGISRVQDRTSYPGSNISGQSLLDTSRNLNLSWRIFDFGVREANRAAASALLDAAIAAHDGALQRLLESVIGGYFDTQTAKASWESKVRLEQLARQTLDTARRREATGAGSQADTLQASTALAKASLERSRAAGDYAKNAAVLVYALGAPAGTSIQLASDPDDDRTSLEHELADWLGQAQTQHPMILAARAQLEAARRRTESVRLEGLPTVDLSASQFRNGRPNQGLPTIQSNERVVAVTLSVPIFDGFARGYKIRNAQAQAEQKEAELLDTEHQILMNVIKAHADAVASLANLSASDDLYKAASLAIASAQRRLDKGAVDVLELLAAQSSMADAEQQRIRSLAEWRSARLKLFAAAGRLGRGQLAR